MGLKKKTKLNAEFNMSSLTDIIFLLLIFFMLTSNLVSPNALNLKLPSSSSKTVAPASISVSIKKGGKFYIGKNRVKQGSMLSGIKSKIRKEKNQKDVTLIINAEKGVAIEHVVFIMDLAMKLGVNAILATDPT